MSCFHQDIKWWTRLLPWWWRFVTRFLTLGFAQQLVQVTLCASVSSPETGQTCLKSTHAAVTRAPFPSGPQDASKPFLPAGMSSLPPTDQAIDVLWWPDPLDEGRHGGCDTPHHSRAHKIGFVWPVSLLQLPEEAAKPQGCPYEPPWGKKQRREACRHGHRGRGSS